MRYTVSRNTLPRRRSGRATRVNGRSLLLLGIASVSAPCQRVQGDAGGGRDVDRIGTGCHRDPHVRRRRRRARPAPSPAPSAPTSSATARSACAADEGVERLRRRPRRQRGDQTMPASRARASASGHGSRRAQGTTSAAPIAVRSALRYSGSTDRRIEQHAGRAEGVRVAQDAADVVGLGDAFDDDERAARRRGGDQRRRRRAQADARRSPGSRDGSGSRRSRR